MVFGILCFIKKATKVPYLLWPRQYLVIIFISILDGLRVPRLIKVCQTLVVSLYLSYSIFKWRILVDGFGRKDIELIIFGQSGSVQLKSMIASTYTILAVFAWKQTIRTILTKTRTTMVMRGYQVIWMNESNGIRKVYHINK